MDTLPCVVELSGILIHWRRCDKDDPWFVRLDQRVLDNVNQILPVPVQRNMLAALGAFNAGIVGTEEDYLQRLDDVIDSDRGTKRYQESNLRSLRSRDNFGQDFQCLVCVVATDTSSAA